MKNVLVTGGAGFVGSHLVERLLKEGYRVLVIDDLSVGKRKYLPKKHKRLTFVNASIITDDIEQYFKNIDIVFHLAALTRPQESILDPINTTQVNVEGLVRVLTYASKNPVKRIVYASTTSLYGTQTQLPTPESVEPHPMSPYALTKLSGEHYCKLFHTMYGLEYNIIRPFNIYGSRQSTKGGYAAAVPTFIRLLNENKAPWITGDGSQARDFIYVDDVVSLLMLMSQSKVHGEIFNAGYGKNTSINDLFMIIARLMHKDIDASHIAPVFEPHETLGDISKAKTLLGWEPKVTLEEGLKKTIRWYKDQASIYLQYAGGNSFPHEIQDKSRGWTEFFESQALVQKDNGAIRPMVTMKTSEISPTGVMVVHASNSPDISIKDIGDMNLKQAQSHLQVVSLVMQSLERMLPHDKVKLWHINNSQEVANKVPSDLGKIPPLPYSHSSQKIAILHSHCDSLSGKGFIQVDSIRELRRQHALHIKASPYAEQVNTFVAERKRNMKPHVFQKLAKSAWDTQLKKQLLKKYPQIFRTVSIESKDQADLSLPPLSLELIGDWETLSKTEFARAVLFTHQFIASRWNSLVNLLKESPQKRSKKDALQKAADYQDWSDKGYNYTIGVIQWNSGNLIFFIDPTIDVAGGVQSTNIHSVRESRELTQLEKTDRELFRATLTKDLLAHNAQFKLGKEGYYLVSQ